MRLVNYTDSKLLNFHELNVGDAFQFPDNPEAVWMKITSDDPNIKVNAVNLKSGFLVEVARPSTVIHRNNLVITEDK